MIRNFQPDDFIKCKEIVNEVWDFDGRYKPIQLAELFKDIYVGSSLSGSNFSIVIEEAGNVQGFLFGKCGNNNLYKNEYSGTWGGIKTLFRIIFVKGVKLKRKLNYLNMIGEHDVNRKKVEPSRENEVNLFAVSPGTQGKGYGKLLMNEFIEFCKKQKVNRITLETDQECNYKFYEHFGFKIKGEFYSSLQKEYSGKSGDCYVYELII